MNTKLTVQPVFGHKTLKVERSTNIKRKAWLAVFAGSALFWMAAAVMVWRVWG